MTLVSNHTATKTDKRVLTSTVNIGVIGCGHWGPKLARNYYELPGSILHTLSDLSIERLGEMQDLYPEARVTQNYLDILNDEAIDAVVVATPVHTHYHLVKAALLAGKHVLVEKPLTSQVGQAQELATLAEERRLTLMVGHTFVYNPAVEAVRDIVQSGALGSIFYCNGTRANLGLLQPDINVLWDLGPHDISLLCYILDAQPVKVSAQGGVYINTRRQLHEVVYMNITFDNGVMANLRLSWLDPVKQRRLTVVGSQKMLVYDDIAEEKVIVFDKGVEVPTYTLTEDEFRASYRHGAETAYAVQWQEPLRIECQHFIDCIQTGATPRSSGRAGLQVVRVLETAQRSLVNGGLALVVEY